jgi:hypothetical protein
MNWKTLPPAVLLALGCFSVVALGDEPKSYSIALDTASKIGTAELQPGNYKLLLHSHSPEVLLREKSSGKETTLMAKVETADAKFTHTAITADMASGSRRIVEIRIGGSKTKVIFK